MAIDLGDAVLKLGGDSKDLDKALDSIEGKANKAFSSVGKYALVGVAALAGVGIGAVKMGADFEGAMREVNTMMGLSEKDFQALSKRVLDLSKRMGVDAVKSVNAMYEAISAGVPEENVLEFLEIASKAAIGGVTDTMITVSGLTTVLNAFKIPVQETTRVADLMFMAVLNGKMTFDELSNSMYIAAPLAASVGMSFDDLMASASTLTKQGAPVNVAMTQIRSALVALISPSKEMAELFDRAGYSSGEAMLKALGFAGSMDALRIAAAGNNEVLTTAFGRIEGLNALLGVTGENAEMAAFDIQSMTESVGATERAFEQMEKSFGRQFDRLMNGLKAFMITVGLEVLPVLTPFIEKLARDLPVALERLIPHIQMAVKVLTQLAGVIGEEVQDALSWLNDMLPTTTAKLWALAGATAAVGAAMFVALTPTQKFLAALAGLASVAIYTKRQWDEIAMAYRIIWAQIVFEATEAFGGLVQIIRLSMQSVWDAIMEFPLFKMTAAMWDLLPDEWKAKLSDALAVVKDFSGQVIGEIGGDSPVWESIVEGARRQLDQAVEYWQQAFKQLGQTVKGFGGDVGADVDDLLDKVEESMKGVAEAFNKTYIEAVPGAVGAGLATAKDRQEAYNDWLELQRGNERTNLAAQLDAEQRMRRDAHEQINADAIKANEAARLLIEDYNRVELFNLAAHLDAQNRMRRDALDAEYQGLLDQNERLRMLVVAQAQQRRGQELVEPARAALRSGTVPTTGAFAGWSLEDIENWLVRFFRSDEPEGFQMGGIVPGPIGRPVLARVHGGEMITPSGMSANIVVYLDGDMIGEKYGQNLVDTIRIRQGIYA